MIFFNVEHGICSFVPFISARAESGRTYLVDCFHLQFSLFTTRLFMLFEFYILEFSEKMLCFRLYYHNEIKNIRDYHFKIIKMNDYECTYVIINYFGLYRSFFFS